MVVAYLAATFRIADGTLYLQRVVTTAAVFAILAVSLDLVAGVTGLYSLGHAGLFALGAYATTLLNQHGWNIFLLLPVSLDRGRTRRDPARHGVATGQRPLLRDHNVHLHARGDRH